MSMRSVVGLAVGLVACSSSPSPSAADAGSDAVCATPGQPASGPADKHCVADDGSAIVQVVHETACAGAADGGATEEEGCAYGPTLFGNEGDDDDCKYHVKWSAGALCEGAAGVPFTVTVTTKGDGQPTKGAGVEVQVQGSAPADAGCDDDQTHSGPNTGVALVEGAAGSYSGHVVFDRAGPWTVRFHIRGDCEDLLEDSPHGHVAFRVELP